MRLSAGRALVLVLLGACGGSSSNGGDAYDPGPVIAGTPLELCVSAESAKYDRMVTCSNVPRARAEEWKALSAELCRRTETAIGEVDAGRASFDATKAVACVTALRATPCSADWLGYQDAPACAGAIAGTAAIGVACRDDVDCIESYCRVEASCPGICTAFGQVNAPCGEDAPCGPGLLCRGPAGAAVCTARGELNQACLAGTCSPGLGCDAGICQPRRSSGACGPADDVCAPGTRCTGGSCQPLLQLGATCVRTDDRCGEGLQCDPRTNACVTLVGQRERCTLDAPEAPLRCQAGYCDFVLGTCRPTKLDHEACSSFTEGRQCWGNCDPARAVCTNAPAACVPPAG
jgi:hypothetical protein